MKGTKNIKRLLLSGLLLFLQLVAYAQDDFIKMMNDTIHSIKYVFEARIDSVQTFAGDEAGNKVQYGSANWDRGIGNFDIKNGRQLMAYSKVWITIAQVYKGKLPKKMVALLPQENTTVIAQVTPKGDTVLSYMQVHSSHGNNESTLLPSKSYPIYRMYWCYDVVKQKHKNEYALMTFLHMPLRIQAFIPNNDGSGRNGIIYTMIGDRIFERQEEFELYLRGVGDLKFK